LSLELQRKLDLDFIKFSPYGLYSVVDWGVILDVRGGKHPPVQAEYPIQRPEDWRKLRPLRGTEGEYLIVLEAQRIAWAEMGECVPLIQTVFSPLTTALKLAGPEKLLAHSAAQGWPAEAYQRLGMGWVVRSHAIEYHQSARASDQITVKTWVATFKRITSLRRYRMIRQTDGALLATAETKWAFINYATGQPHRVPMEIVSAFEIVEAPPLSG
jgi:acyl-CoA thioesterase FadM